MTAPKFITNCMCDKYTNCTDCQKHDTAIRNATLDEVETYCKTNVIKRASEQWDCGYNTGMGDVLNKCKSLRTKKQP